MTYPLWRHWIIGIALAIALPQGAGAQLAAPPPPDLNARGYLLVDFDSGRVLASKNADESMEPASITKLMTAYVVFRAIRSGQVSLDDEVVVSEKAWRTTGSRMFIEVGKKVRVDELLQGMIVQSGNDASVALAEFVAGTEESFSQIMNQLARELGMTKSSYRNSTGLPAEGHVTSPEDIAKLAQALIREFPDYYAWYSQREYTYNGITQANRNGLLLRDSSVDGMKTGYTDSAGYCLVSSAERDGMRLIAVVLGTKSDAARVNDSQALLNYGFRFYETHQLWEAGQVVSDTRVWKGEVERTELVVQQPVHVTIPRGKLEQLETRLELPAAVLAPLSTETPVGEVQAVLGINTVASAPVYSQTAVAEAGLLSSTWDELLLWFQ
ncbi:MAG: D-alanyl-D-alanine carboxypeptidase family protein [Gammaproteobacteria bacterium]|jgi:D-alanyl-D-alanine carboxypeptidase (penicillin-binding protein 5/6)|nr:D-alanyl-D-alanine carboxypeptidase family protein [Gammaproteobacteria bacterium]